MWKRIIPISLFSLIAVCGAAAPSQAGGFAYPWGLAPPHYGACLPFGFFFYGSHLGLGPGYPGLYAYPGLYPYSCGRIIPCPRLSAMTIVLSPHRRIRVYVKGTERQVVQSDEPVPAPSGSTGSTKYGSFVEHARKLYPNGLPPIESIWYPDGSVQKMNNR